MDLSVDNLEELIVTFYEKWYGTNSLWKKEFSPYSSSSMEYKGFILNISYGKGVRLKPPKFPYITFLKYGFKTSKGVYPYVAINTDKNLLETYLGVSHKYEPDVSHEKLEKIKEYSRKHKKYFKVSEIDDLIHALNKNIEVFEKIINSNEDKKKMLNIKNIILYGVPGVGKTHNIAKLITLIEEGKSEREIFDAIRRNDPYDREPLEDIQDRIEFVTFHQSFGYEDFIEGFRPNEEGKIELVDGIFKHLSLRAKENFIDSRKETQELEKESFLLEKIKRYIAYKIQSDEPIKLKKGSEFKLIQFDNSRLVFSASENSLTNKEFIIKISDFMKICQSDREKHTLKDIADILGTSSIQQKYSYYLALYKDFKDFDSSYNDKHKSKIESIEEKNYYLIIDEINRGNISKIFGELITLIEEDKRDTYEVTLPYSKERFSVPSNLYIIGTMNSTDKSIALIDIALRRRFTFLKMQPNDDLVPEFAKDLFNSLNENISERLGDEYQIGHSYFMNIENEEDLEFVLEYKIKPLLEEYFYGDKDGLLNVIELISQKR